MKNYNINKKIHQKLKKKKKIHQKIKKIKYTIK